ncbi:transcriptional regulator [Pseudooceanicola sediminis]|uniref:Transcriptional regulator n=1 Tax=Pseudooceanicola sediminis TaxID=2211117 RepID=A0A399J4V7_9RHOB|nr:helix-turn-helix domain-containing protein [Pseudooceanicola sediminis]KAA2317182.1 helix-turn-helix transcriptional regulator [Puniceibacterium sp. HSS470]RII40468.1 transcriptional regulator [Pseudooceanicola sediminis]|tara:strand:- start:53152 stop:53541 length:390 start_codon:yes stop_codon:yes gene_type:complete
MEDLSYQGVRCDVAAFSVDCPNRELFDQIADKWSMMILTVLDTGPTRFNEIKRQLEGISQKSLTQTLRKLERNGLVIREVIDTSPVAVQYQLSDLGGTLLPPFRALYGWTKHHLGDVLSARATYDARVA